MSCTATKEITAKESLAAKGIGPNTLISYHGGGYDGCNYEWTYCFIDNDGEFCDIASSGYKAITSMEDLVECLEGWKWAQDEWYREHDSMPSHLKHCLRHSNPSDEVCIFDLKIEPDDEQNVFNRFADTTPVDHLLGVANWFQARLAVFTFSPRCDECGNRFDAVNGRVDSLHGCGGIAVEHGRIICGHCLSVGTCDYCGEYVGGEDMAKDQEHPEDRAESGYCKWCEEQQNDGPKAD